MIFFFFFAQNIDCGNMLEPPRRGGSNKYPQSMFWSKNKKIGSPLQTPVFLYKSGVKGVQIARICYPDNAENHLNMADISNDRFDSIRVLAL